VTVLFGNDGERFTWSRFHVGTSHDGLLAASACEFDLDDEDAAFTYANQLLSED
jgi:hypothetical protein